MKFIVCCPRLCRFCIAASLALALLALSSCCDSDTVPTHTNLLYSSSAKERNKAALALARCGDEAAQAVPRLIELMYDENVGVQSSAAYALRRIDTPAARNALDRAERARRNRR